MKLYMKNEVLLKRIKELGEQISKDYEGKDIIAVGLLKGCVIFMAHLLLEIKGKVAIDFMTISSYKHGTKSDNFKFIQDLDTDVKGKNVLIIEDIIDTGKTMAFTQNYLKERGARSVETVTLVDKKSRRKYKIEEPKYIGFNYNEEPFIVGFGFDYGGIFRNLPDVYQLESQDM